MARRQRTLYEFVDPDQLANEESAQPADATSSSTRRRPNMPGRVAAGIALIAGAALFVVGVMQLRTPLTSGARRDNQRAAPSAQRSVLPGAPARRRRTNRHSPARHKHVIRGHAPSRPAPRTRATAAPSPVPAQAAPVTHVAPRPVRPPAPAPASPVGGGASEFGFER